MAVSQMKKGRGAALGRIGGRDLASSRRTIFSMGANERRRHAQLLRPGKFTEQIARRRHISGVGRFRRGESTKICPSPFVANDCLPAAGPAVQAHALVAGGVVPRTAAVRGVLRRRCPPQVGPTVICRIAVAVVDHRTAPPAGHIPPRQLVGLVRTIIEAYFQIPCPLTESDVVADTLPPAELAGVAVVVQQLAQPRAG